MKKTKKRHRMLPEPFSFPKGFPLMPKESFFNLCRIPSEKKTMLWHHYNKAFAHRPSKSKAAIVFILTANKIYNKPAKSFTDIAREITTKLRKQGLHNQLEVSHTFVRKMSLLLKLRPAKKYGHEKTSAKPVPRHPTAAKIKAEIFRRAQTLHRTTTRSMNEIYLQLVKEYSAKTLQRHGITIDVLNRANKKLRNLLSK